MVSFSYRPLVKGLTIRQSSVDGLGLFSTTKWRPAKMLGETHFLVENEWKRTPLGGFINHSDEPNCVIITDNDIRTLYTVKPIDQGEELTIFYTLNQ